MTSSNGVVLPISVLLSKSNNNCDNSTQGISIKIGIIDHVSAIESHYRQLDGYARRC